MTLQIADGFEYDNKVFDLVSKSGPGYIFNPGEYGFFPKSTCTASHRGFRSIFAINEGLLILVQLDINLFSEDKDYPWIPQKGESLNGVEPEFGRTDSLFNNKYINPCLPVQYDGRVLIADEFIQELYEHMGFAVPWKYGKVIELTFSKGRFTGERDRSEEMKLQREEVRKTGDPFAVVEDHVLIPPPYEKD